MKKIVVVLLVLALMAALTIPAMAAEYAVAYCPTCKTNCGYRSAVTKVYTDYPVSSCEYHVGTHQHVVYRYYNYLACDFCGYYDQYDTIGTYHSTWCGASNMYLRVDTVHEIC